METTHYHTEIKENDLIRFMYINWKGDFSIRVAKVKSIFFGTTKYHPDYQCFIRAFDLNKMETRDFAVKDISSIEAIDVDKEVE